MDEHVWVAYALLAIAFADIQRGELVEARATIGEAVAVAREAGTVQESIEVIELIAAWLGAAGEHAAAVTFWAAADRAWRDRGLLAKSDGARAFATALERDRQALRPSQAERAWSTGLAMSLEDALHASIERLGTTIVTVPKGTSPAVIERGPLDLSTREREVLRLLVDGCSDGDIADALFISKKTASVHVANIKGKLGAATRVEIATIAVRRGLATISSNERSD